MGQMIFCLNLLFGLVLTGSLALAQPNPGNEGATPEAGGDKGEQLSFTIENSLSIRDPFRRPIMTGPSVISDSTPELQRYDLDKLRLVGVITGPRKAKALLTVPGGKMHIVSQGEMVGTRKGHITKIAPGMIAVEEKVVNLLGQEESVETVIEFKEEKKGSL